MAQHPNSISKRFQKGQTGNPNGYSKRAREAGVVRRVGKETLNRIAETFFEGSIDGLRELSQAKDLTPVEKLFIAVLLKAVEKGDTGALNTILDRFIGKERDVVEVKNVNTDINDFRSLTDDEILRRRELLVKANNDSGT